MSFGFFEHISAFDEQAQVATRKALAVARRRVEDNYGAFLHTAKSQAEYLKRLEMVANEVDESLRDVADEYGADPEKITAAVKEVLAAGGYCDDCKAWKSGPNGGGCTCGGYKSDDDGDDDDDDKKESKVAEHIVPLDDIDRGIPEGVSNLDAELADAPSAVGYGTAQGTLSGHQAAFPEYGFGGEVTNAAPDGFPVDRTHTPPSIAPPSTCPNCGKAAVENGTCVNCGHRAAPVAPAAPLQAVAADVDTGDSAEKRKKLPTGDESALAGPSPEIDKRTWKPNALGTPNLHPIDTDGGRYKTTQQDVTDTPDWESDGWDAKSPVVERESLPADISDAGWNDGGVNKGPHTDTWSGMDGQTDPVTKAAAIDPEKNPIRDILDEGFLPSDEVNTAIEQYREDHNG